jgi:catechol-2,3-dioxygenase
MIERFATVALWVEDFTSVLYFYQVILGLDLISHHGDVPQLKVGDGILVLVKGKLPHAIDAFPPDFPLISFEVNNLDKMMETLIAENVELKSSIEERRDSRWIKVCDPAGNLIELVEIK